MNREEIIKKLITDFHINNEERRYLKNVSFKEVYTSCESILKSNKFFPLNAFTWEKGMAVYEGYFIEMRSSNNYRVHIQRHYPNNPYLLAEHKETDFDSLTEALDFFCKEEWGYTIDGVVIN
jgi:hypothetical protein